MRTPLTLRRLITGVAAVLALVAGSVISGGSPAQADTALVPTTFTLTLSGTRMTATLTAADGSVPAGVPVGVTYQLADGGGVAVNSGAVTDANGQYSLDNGYPDVGTTYSFWTPGDSTYGPSTSNPVHVSAQVTTRLHVYSDLHGASAAGTVTSLRGYKKPGITVQLYADAAGHTTQVGSAVSDSLGGWSVSLPIVTTPTVFQAAVVSDAEDTGSSSNSVRITASTRTTVAAATSGGNVTVHGAVVDGNGTGQAALHVQILVGPRGSAKRTLGVVTTDGHGHYSYTGPACTTACYYEAIAQQETNPQSSWALTGTIKAPTRLVMIGHRGRPDRLTATLTRAADHAPVANQKITIYYHYTGKTRWVRQTVVSTNRSGQVVLPERPKRACYFTARYTGNSILAGAASTNVYLRS